VAHPANVGAKRRRVHRRWAVARLRASGGGRISATELALSDEGFEDFSAPHRRKAARAIFLADEEHDALLVGQAAIDFGERQRRIAVAARPLLMPLISITEKFSPRMSSSAEAKRKWNRP
jgi:hypothetical protein